VSFITFFRTKSLSDTVKELEDKVDVLIQTVDNKNHKISVCNDELLGLKAEMSVVNKVSITETFMDLARMQLFFPIEFI
jgi:hypothetical protein